jgi:hypothetical protein
MHDVGREVKASGNVRVFDPNLATLGASLDCEGHRPTFRDYIALATKGRL